MRRVVVPEIPVANLEHAAGRSIVYEWMWQDEWERVIALTDSAPRPPRSGSIEHFVMSQEWGYRQRTNGALLEYRVSHAPWRFAPTAECLLEADVEALYGRRFATAFDA